MARRLWLVAARRDRGLSQAAVARACGAHQPTVAHWESGVSPVPAHKVAALAQALGIDPWIIHVSMGQIPPELATHDPEAVASALRALPADDGQGMARYEAAIRAKVLGEDK